jgi:hypothetical protein
VTIVVDGDSRKAMVGDKRSQTISRNGPARTPARSSLLHLRTAAAAQAVATTRAAAERRCSAPRSMRSIRRPRSHSAMKAERSSTKPRDNGAKMGYVPSSVVRVSLASRPRAIGAGESHCRGEGAQRHDKTCRCFVKYIIAAQRPGLCSLPGPPYQSGWFRLRVGQREERLWRLHRLWRVLCEPRRLGEPDPARSERSPSLPIG